MQIVFITLLLLFNVTLSTATDTILRVDSGGHTSKIRDILVSKDKSEIISASHDKTIRVWDTKSGDLKRKILGHIGLGNEGMIFTIALSSDNEYLAVAGMLANNPQDGSAIRIYHYPTGKLIRVLKSHTNVINDLNFSKDGNYLVSASSDRSVKIWDIVNWRLRDTIPYHMKEVRFVEIKKHKKAYDIYSVSNENKITLHRFDKRLTRFVNEYKFSTKIDSIASTSHVIAVASGDKISILDRELTLKKDIYENGVLSLAYSPDSKLLISSFSIKPYSVKVYSVDDDYKVKQTFSRHTKAATVVKFLDNSTAISAGGVNEDIFVWDIRSAKDKIFIEPSCDTVFVIGVDGDNLAWGNVDPCPTCRNNSGKHGRLDKLINLKTFSILDIESPAYKTAFKDKEPPRYYGISIRNGSYKLKLAKAGLNSRGDAVLKVNRKTRTISRIKRDAYNGSVHRTYGWYKDYIVSGGANGHLKIYSKDAKEVASLVGHNGEILSLALEGDRLISGGSDKTIRVWDLSQLEKNSVLYPILNIFVGSDDEWVIWSKSGYYNSSVAGDKYLGYHINKSLESESQFVSSGKYFKKLYRPDIIRNIWITSNEKKAIAIANKAKPVRSVDIKSSLPPRVSLLSRACFETNSTNAKVEFYIDSDEYISEIVVIHNGKKIDTKLLVRNKDEYKKSIKILLDDGKNIISIKAKNKFAMSDTVFANIDKNSKRKNSEKPTLFLLSIGLGKYEKLSYNQGLADKNAKDISEMFKNQKGSIYKKVVKKILVNSVATSSGILNALGWIYKKSVLGEATVDDVVVIFLAGQGIKDKKGNYFFLSYDSNLKELEQSSVRFRDIESIMKYIPSKVILFADISSSDVIPVLNRNFTKTVKSIINSGSDSVIMASTTGGGHSFKNSYQNSLFTKSILDGVQNMKADYNADSVVTIDELGLYLQNNIKKLSNGEQKPTIVIPKSFPYLIMGKEL